MRRRDVARAGFNGDIEVLTAAADDPDPALRATALAGLDRLARLDDATLAQFLADPAPEVRRRAAGLAARRPGVCLQAVLLDPDPFVVETAAWACGEQGLIDDDTLTALVAVAGDHGDPLAREAAVAALGALGDPRGLDTLLAGTGDRPAIRRRAVIALAAFDGPQVEAALARALEDKDWQVREAAEELLRVDPR
jgi:HEAT repeat protein